MNNIYHSDIYQFNTPVNSYWEDTSSENLNLEKLTKDINSEIVVIGGGYTGLLCAINLIVNYNLEVILDMYPEGYSLHHNGVWNIIEAVCEACEVHTASITLVIGDMAADYPCNVIIHQPRWLMETSAEFPDFKQDFSKVAERKFLHNGCSCSDTSETFNGPSPPLKLLEPFCQDSIFLK